MYYQLMRNTEMSGAREAGEEVNTHTETLSFDLSDEFFSDLRQVVLQW